jgi:NADPH-dependent ferric siderophore reductase
MTLHQISRIRREVRRRRLIVSSVDRLTPRMLRIGFTSEDLSDFASAAHDDHIKLFFPDAPAEAEGKPCMRDFTPRAFDTARGTLTIDFALHESGPATAWASEAKPGDQLEIGGPRGSMVVPDDFDWYLLLGDETALPAIGRKVEELRPGVSVTTIVVVEDEGEIQDFPTRAAWNPLWVTRRSAGLDDAASLRGALAGFTPPPGDGFVWIAAEAAVARSLRSHVVEAMGHLGAWVKAAGYWKRGQSDTHERIED